MIKKTLLRVLKKICGIKKNLKRGGNVFKVFFIKKICRLKYEFFLNYQFFKLLDVNLRVFKLLSDI